VIRQTRFHRGRDTKSAVYATEVLVREMNRKRQFQVVQLFRERISQARKAAKLHPHGQVLALDKTGQVGIRVAQKRVEGLERVRSNWEKLRDEGMPWPGDSANQRPSA
jgi:galactose-1-phosphate uridylyltransferase